MRRSLTQRFSQLWHARYRDSRLNWDSHLLLWGSHCHQPERQKSSVQRQVQPNPNICGQFFKNNPFLACIIPQETSGSKRGTVVRALTSHQCGPGSNPCDGAICGLSFLMVPSLALRGFSLGTPVFHSPSKLTWHFQIQIGSGLHGHVSTIS